MDKTYSGWEEANGKNSFIDQSWMLKKSLEDFLENVNPQALPGPNNLSLWDFTWPSAFPKASEVMLICSQHSGKKHYYQLGTRSSTSPNKMMALFVYRMLYIGYLFHIILFLYDFILR